MTMTLLYLWNTIKVTTFAELLTSSVWDTRPSVSGSSSAVGGALKMLAEQMKHTHSPSLTITQIALRFEHVCVCELLWLKM